jgi:hypothetical protein
MINLDGANAARAWPQTWVAGAFFSFQISGTAVMLLLRGSPESESFREVLAGDDFGVNMLTGLSRSIDSSRRKAVEPFGAMRRRPRLEFSVDLGAIEPAERICNVENSRQTVIKQI